MIKAEFIEKRHFFSQQSTVDSRQQKIDCGEGIGEIDSIGGLDDWHFAELSVQTPSAIKNSSGTSCRSRIPGVDI
jgi:hypothetical protein